MEKIKIGITGQNGFVGTHLKNTIEKLYDNFEIIDFLLGSSGDKFDSLYIKDGGLRNPVSESSFEIKTDDKGYSRRNIDLFMDGESIFNFTLSKVPENITKILEKNNLSINHIKYFFLHQANKFILDFIGRKMNLQDRLLIDLEETGNTTSSSIPILISRNLDNINIKMGDFCVFTGFGVGLSWGSVLLRKN
jgi:3-oxoacyl-[acyl-carrier-protein] synthase-3